MISIRGISKPALLAALYNASRPLGLGRLNPAGATGMTEDEAEAEIERRRNLGVGPRFDYLNGRVMKVDLSGEEFDPQLYDRDNGEGAAWRAIVQLFPAG